MNLKDMIESLDHGIIYIGPDRNLIESNNKGLSFLVSCLGLNLESTETVPPEKPISEETQVINDWYMTGLKGIPSQGTMSFKEKGDNVSYLVKASPVFDSTDSIKGVSITTTDVSVFFDQIEVLTEQADKDPLTGLYNRRGYETLTKKELKRSERDGSVSAIVIVDLDHLKTVNDTYGHLVGDKAIQKIATHLTTAFREGDIVARYGGDEYIITATNIKEVNGFYKKIKNIVEDIGHDRGIFNLNPSLIPLSVSVGIYVIDEPSMPLENAIENADAALYNAKENGRNQAWFYDSSTQQSKKIE